MRRWFAFLLALALALSAQAARANGRFPNAQQLREISPGSLAISGSYGLLVSGNAKDFQFVCESALFGKTLQGSWIDPLLEVLSDGTLLSGSLNGLRVSRDHGCSFRSDWSLPHDPAFIPPDPSATGPAGTVVDLCPSYDSAQGMLALTTLSASDQSTLEHQLYYTNDGARSWSPWGAPIPTSLVRVVLTVDVAASDPKRVYVSGSSLGSSVLLVSADAGATWAAHPLTLDDAAGVAGLYIAAVSKKDPNRLYLRASRRSLAEDGSTTWDDSLLVSDDGGVSVHEVLRRPAALLGFALSPDDGHVLAGYGDPVVAPVVVDETAVGLYAASSDTLEFSHPIADWFVSCLRWESDGLFACAKESDPLASQPGLTDFHIGVFAGSGVPTARSDFSALVKLKDLRGPLPLASGAPSACAAEWATGDPMNPGQPSVCASLGACASSPPPLSPGAFECGATSVAEGGDAGAGGAAAANEQGGASSAAQAGTSGDSASGGKVASGASVPSSGNGGCRLGEGRPSGSPAWQVALALLALLVHRRRLSFSLKAPAPLDR